MRFNDRKKTRNFLNYLITSFTGNEVNTAYLLILIYGTEHFTAWSAPPSPVANVSQNSNKN